MRETLWKVGTAVETAACVSLLAALGCAWVCGKAAYQAGSRAISPGKR